jgi:hypothetical protein
VGPAPTSGRLASDKDISSLFHFDTMVRGPYVAAYYMHVPSPDSSSVGMASRRLNSTDIRLNLCSRNLYASRARLRLTIFLLLTLRLPQWGPGSIPKIQKVTSIIKDHKTYWILKPYNQSHVDLRTHHVILYQRILILVLSILFIAARELHT